MDAPNVWVAKHDGSDIVRATAIVGVGIDYNGNITARLGHGEGATVTLADPGRQHGDHPGGIFTASWSVSLPSYPTHPEPSWCGRYVMRCMAGNGSPNLFDFLSALKDSVGECAFWDFLSWVTLQGRDEQGERRGWCRAGCRSARHRPG